MFYQGKKLLVIIIFCSLPPLPKVRKNFQFVKVTTPELSATKNSLLHLSAFVGKRKHTKEEKKLRIL